MKEKNIILNLFLENSFMLRNSEQKIKLLVLYDLLCRFTDGNYALNTDKILLTEIRRFKEICTPK